MRVFITFFIVLLSPIAAGAAPSYSISYYSSSEPIEVENVSRFHFKPLNDYRELRATGAKGYYLFKVSFTNPLPDDGYLLFIENEHLDSVLLYQRQADSLALTARAGNSFPGSESRLGLPQFRLDGESREYYILTRFPDDVYLNFRIDTPDSMNRWSMAVFFKLGLYYGVSLMFFVLNLFLFLYLKDRLFLYYCFFQFFIVASIAYADGLFPFVFSWRWLLNHADIPLHTGLAFSGSLFALAFLEKARRSQQAILSGICLVLMSTAYVLSLMCTSYALFMVGECLALLILCFFWLMAAAQFQKHRHSRFFALGYGVFLVFAVDYFLLRKLDVYILDFYMGQIKTGSVIEMLVLSIAIVVRMTTLRDENVHYRRTIEQHMQDIARLEETHPVADTYGIFDRVQQKYNLTDRETEILRGISEGLTNNQIAEKVSLSVHTVKFHTRNVFEKLNITNRTQALIKLNEKGEEG